MRKILRMTFLFLSIGIFLFSLTQNCYCTGSSCCSSFAALLFGIPGLFLGGMVALTWLANPLLSTSWIFIKKNPKLSLIMSLLATLIALSFLLFDKIVDNEGGGYSHITGYQAGYYLWVLSSVTMLMGNLMLLYFEKTGRFNNENDK